MHVWTWPDSQLLGINDQHLAVYVCMCVRERQTQRENSYVGSKAPRLSYLISLIRTQTIIAPWLSTSFIPLLTSPRHLSYNPATVTLCGPFHWFCIFTSLITSPISIHLSIHPSIYPLVLLLALVLTFDFINSLRGANVNPECNYIHYIRVLSRRMYQSTHGFKV